MLNNRGSIPAVSVIIEPLVQAPAIRWERAVHRWVGGPVRLCSYLSCKPLIDRVAALLVLLLLAPLLLFVAVAIKIEDGGPVLVHRLRVGRAGELFWMPAFRTVVYSVAGARSGVAGARSGVAGARSGVAGAQGGQLTRVGRLLRRCGVHELPQLVNVVHGRLAIVGPRPLTLAQYGAGAGHHRLVRPGLTGLWQEAGPAEPSRDQAAELELRYAQSCSVAVDLAICWKTAGAVLGVRDAH